MKSSELLDVYQTLMRKMESITSRMNAAFSETGIEWDPRRKLSKQALFNAAWNRVAVDRPHLTMADKSLMWQLWQENKGGEEVEDDA